MVLYIYFYLWHFIVSCLRHEFCLRKLGYISKEIDKINSINSREILCVA